MFDVNGNSQNVVDNIKTVAEATRRNVFIDETANIYNKNKNSQNL